MSLTCPTMTTSPHTICIWITTILLSARRPVTVTGPRYRMNSISTCMHSNNSKRRTCPDAILSLLSDMTVTIYQVVNNNNNNNFSTQHSVAAIILALTLFTANPCLS